MGENVGLMTATHISGQSCLYRCLNAEYMQNGSIGRRLNLEVRVWDDAVAFRYVIPRSTALDEILIDNELTEFHIAHPGHKIDASRPRRCPYVVLTAGRNRKALHQ